MEIKETDEEGYLVKPSTWNEEIARILAEEDNIQLTENHWDAIRFMREYYAEH
jgi:dissimilatory sulfite reductase related protein